MRKRCFQVKSGTWQQRSLDSIVFPRVRFSYFIYAFLVVAQEAVLGSLHLLLSPRVACLRYLLPFDLASDPSGFFCLSWLWSVHAGGKKSWDLSSPVLAFEWFCLAFLKAMQIMGEDIAFDWKAGRQCRRWSRDQIQRRFPRTMA